MGITSSIEENQSEQNSQLGYRPKKLKKIDIEYHDSNFTYIVGDGKLLKFDLKKWSLHQEIVHIFT